jgi:uncharacterized protein YqgC (DUF456 family)
VENALNIVILVLALLAMAVGLVGTVAPVVPGAVLIFGAALVYAVIDGFQLVGWPTIVIMGLIAAVATTADLWASSLGAKAGGASGWSVLAGAIGGFAGLILFSLPGAIIGAVLAVLLAEVVRLQDPLRAAKAGGGWLLGWALSTLVHLSLGLIMVAIFVWQVIRGL